MRIGNLHGGGRVVKTLLGFCLCCRHRPQPAPTRPPWLGERLFRTSCAKIATHHTKSKAVSKLHLNLHSNSLSAQATPPHHQKTPVSLSTTLQHRSPAQHNSKGAKRPTLNHTSHSTTTARVCKHPTLEGKNSPGWWAGCGCVV